MLKGYWVTAYQSTVDPARLESYVKVAGPVIEAHGGRILARGRAAAAYESGLMERLVIIEFESVKRAIQAYTSPEYQAAAAILQGAARRDVRIVEGS